MKIESIKVIADKTLDFKLNDSLTIISDKSGAGKTLLFRFIEYLLGADGRHIDIEEANRVFSGLKAIEMTINDGTNIFTFKRYFGLKKNEIFQDGKEIEDDYITKLNKVINYNPIKVLKNKKELKLTTFTLREYVKSLFFNESKLTSSTLY